MPDIFDTCTDSSKNITIVCGDSFSRSYVIADAVEVVFQSPSFNYQIPLVQDQEDPTKWLLTLTSQQTEIIEAGSYEFQIKVSNSQEVVSTFLSGLVTFMPAIFPLYKTYPIVLKDVDPLETDNYYGLNTLWCNRVNKNMFFLESRLGGIAVWRRLSNFNYLYQMSITENFMFVGDTTAFSFIKVTADGAISFLEGVYNEESDKTEYTIDLTDPSPVFTAYTIMDFYLYLDKSIESRELVGSIEEELIPDLVLYKYNYTRKNSDTVEVATYEDLPENPLEGILYVVLADETSGGNLSSYRWSGSVFIKITDLLSSQEVKALYENNPDTNVFSDQDVLDLEKSVKQEEGVTNDLREIRGYYKEGTLITLRIAGDAEANSRIDFTSTMINFYGDGFTFSNYPVVDSYDDVMYEDQLVSKKYVDKKFGRVAYVKYQSSSGWCKVAEIDKPLVPEDNESIVFLVTAENASSNTSEKYIGILEMNIDFDEGASALRWLTSYGFGANNFNLRVEDNKLSLWVVPTTGTITFKLLVETKNGQVVENIVLFNPIEPETRTGSSLGYSTKLNDVEALVDDYKLEAVKPYVTVGTVLEGHTLDQVDFLCDGVNDEVAINEAINSLSKGGIVLIFEGSYNITSPILISNSNIIIRGKGSNTILKRMWTSLNIEGVIENSLDTYYISVENLEIEGNESNYPSSEEGINVGILIKDTSKVNVSNVIFRRNKTSIYIKGSHYVTIEGNSIFSYSIPSSYAIYSTEGVEGASVSLSVLNNSIEDSDNGIYVESEARNTNINNNNIRNISDCAIKINSVNNTTSIYSNLITLADKGIYLNSSEHSVVSNNIILDSSYGIRLEYNTDIIVSNNIAYKGEGSEEDYMEDEYSIFSMNGVSNFITGNLILGKGVVISGGTGNISLNNISGPESQISSYTAEDKSKVDNLPLNTNKELNILDNKVDSITVGTVSSGHTLEQVDFLCDGVNDEVEIQSAILLASSLHKNVLILDGEYLVQNNIMLESNMIISGCDNTIINGTTSASSTIRAFYALGLVDNYKENIIIRNFKIKTIGRAVAFTYVKNSLVENVTVDSCYYGLICAFGESVKFKNCSISNSLIGNVLFTCVNSEISNCYMYEAGTLASIKGNSNLLIKNRVINVTKTAMGISIDGSVRNIVDNNYVEGVISSGIYAYSGNTELGALCELTNDNIISNNIIKLPINQGEVDQLIGITVGGKNGYYADNNIVYGNMLLKDEAYGTEQYSMYFNSHSRNNLAFGNKYTGPIYNTGIDNKVEESSESVTDFVTLNSPSLETPEGDKLNQKEANIEFTTKLIEHDALFGDISTILNLLLGE
jgi:parallel beta-helix repeat protein